VRTQDVSIEAKVGVQGGGQVGRERDADRVGIGALLELLGVRQSWLFVWRLGIGGGLLEQAVDEVLETRLFAFGIMTRLAAQLALEAALV
jgi:hypothetical protein